MPSLSQSFRIAVLPRVSSLSNYDVQTNNLQVAGDIEPSSNRITIGISESAISQYVLNPTPKLVQSVPIPSTTMVTACDVSQSNDGEQPRDIWCYSLQSGKVYSLNVAIRKNGDENLANLEVGAKIKMKDRVVGIRINGKDKAIVVVLKCGLIQFYDFQLKLQHSLDMSYSDVGFIKFFQEHKKDFLFVLCSLPGSKVCFKLFELTLPNYNQVPVKELSSVTLEDFSLNESKICYQSGRLYRLVNNKVLTYALPQCQLIQTTELPMIKEAAVISIQPISTNRILVTADNKVFLLDLAHNSTLFSRELSHLKTFQLLQSGVIDSHEQSLNSNQRTFAIGVGTKSGKNPVSSLEIINVDVGTGTLKDSLGKGFTASNEPASHALKPLFSDDEDEIDEDERNLRDFNFEAIYQTLKKNTNSVASFDRIFQRELNIQKEHYTEADRFICDVNFLSKVVHLIVQNFKEEYPKALTFLLTHPLFPVDCTSNLFARLREHPRLFKQAIVTCPNLPLKELLSELFSIRNGELSLDISIRILQDYTSDMIKQEMKALSKVDIQNFIDFIISSRDDEVVRNSRQLFQLLSLVLDSIGLFALDLPLLDRLSEYIDSQVVIAERNSKLCDLIDDRQSSRGYYKSTSYAIGTQGEPTPKYQVELLEL
ncbi:hypothetical protein HG537_0C05260 [Torulaspora globosa]|uniref:Uncharacterized protein n=1 Tax=Torulaspora globosa TaxID=48254 RepID=A0A7H9HQ64_9SACH|nr:hypothetical protein HG537_0C05260 [Torulaspora sp. CBS 2947]